MQNPIADLLNDQMPLIPGWAKLAVIVGLFVTAWLVSRSSALVARKVLVWHDRRHESTDLEATGKIANIKRRETHVTVVRTAIAYVAFATATVLSVAQLAGGVDKLTALAGGAFAVLVLGFAAQRILIDIIAGFAMFVERWYSVGDTIVVHSGVEHQGVVEDLSLRRTKLRSLNGEVIHVHNSQITSVRVLPRGVKELAIELFVSKRGEGENLVEGIARILPGGPTTFVKRPWVEHVEELSHALTRIRLRATVAPGREWLAEDFFAKLLHEKAPDGLIVHGPVTLAVDERAARSYARASAATRWDARRTHRSEALDAA